jgi:hypothetical protein
LKKCKLLLWIFITGFITNLIWENAQAPLYEGYMGFLQHFETCLIATVADVIYILVLYFAYAVFCKDKFWVKHMNWKIILPLFLVGALLAIAFEKWALARGEWNYRDAMPIIPLVNVEWIPVIQLMILSFLSYYLAFKIAMKRGIVVK